jgi:ribosomal protein S2
MKINRLKKTQNKTLLLKLKILKNQTYYQFSVQKINDIFLRLKKAITLIFQYHKNNKKILIVGLPIHTKSKIKTYLQKLKHIFIPYSSWVTEMMINKQVMKSSSSFNFNQKPTVLKQLTKKIDLIIIFNSFEKKSFITESSIFNIPIISFSNFDFFNEYSSYNIPYDFKFTKKKINSNLLFFLIPNIFKKAEKTKRLNNTFKSLFLQRKKKIKYYKKHKRK